MELQTDRPQSMNGPGPIPFTSICKYAEIYQFRGEGFEDLLFFVRRMERTWNEWRDSKRNQPAAPANGVSF